MDSETCPRHVEGCEELARMDRLMEAQTGAPFVATYGRYHEGRCLQCGERAMLAPGTESCFLCL